VAKKTEFADSISLNTYPQVMDVGGDTTVETIAFIATVKKIALHGDRTKWKVGDQIKWKATLNGRMTLNEEIIGAALNEWLK
jgi:hypothetical protein